ncbi:MAG: hypothetical protein RLZZ455_1033 [Candidatus Parcubacteria bacterium]
MSTIVSVKTQIIATIGPATLDFPVFSSLIRDVSMIRINTAYGDEAQYDRILENLRRSGQKDVRVMFDIKNHSTIPYILKNNISVIAHSFTQSAADLQELRRLVPGVFVIAKIETKEGVANFAEISDEADGVMIARGDLGEAVTLEKLPCLQKRFTKQCIEKKKFVIAATEMLLSMTEHMRPTRAEVSDVANAVFDGVDAVMLSEETAIGKYPIEAVTCMKDVIVDAERCDWD